MKERRKKDEVRAVLSPEFAHGWLAFQALGGKEKRRLAPIPPAWRLLKDEDLAKLVDSARQSAQHRRLIE